MKQFKSILLLHMNEEQIFLSQVTLRIQTRNKIAIYGPGSK